MMNAAQTTIERLGGADAAVLVALIFKAVNQPRTSDVIRLIVWCLVRSVGNWRQGGLRPIVAVGSELRSMHISPQEDVLATGDISGWIKVWVLSSGKLRSQVQCKNMFARCLCFSSDGSKLVSGFETGSSSAGVIQIWDVDTLTRLGILEGLAAVYCAAFVRGDTQVLCGCHDARVILLDAVNLASVAIFTGHQRLVLALDVASSSSQRFCTGSSDTTIRLWTLGKPDEVSTVLRGHTDWVRSVQFSNSSRTILSSSRDALIILWNATSGELLREFRGHTRGPQAEMSSACYLGSNVIASIAGDRTLRFWSVDGKASAVCSSYGASSLIFARKAGRLLLLSRIDEVREWIC